MKEINRAFILILLGCFMFTSCIDIDVSYENLELHNVPNFTVEKNLGDKYLFTHVDTTANVLIVFHVFSQCDISSELLKVKNFELKDDTGKVLFESKDNTFSTTKNKKPNEGFYHNIYMFKFGSIPIDRKILIDKNIKYLTVEYEIDGKPYFEKLERIERKSFITP